MARINPVNPETASGKTKALFDGVKAKLGMVPNMMKTMGGAPAVLEGYLSLSGALAHGELPLKVREQISLEMAQVNACEYCLSAHSALGKGAGLSAAEINGARRGQGTDGRATAVLALTKRLVETKGGITDADMKAAREGGLTDGQIMEVVAHVALETFTNYFNRAFAVEIDFPKVGLSQQVA